MVEIIKFQEPAFERKPRTIRQQPVDKNNVYMSAENTHDILRITNKHIERLAVSELKGNQRRNYFQDKLTQLGIPPEKRLSHHLPRVPTRIAREMVKTAETRASKLRKERDEAGDDLIVSSASSHIVSHKVRNTETHVWTSSAHPMKASFDRKLKKAAINKTLGRTLEGERRWEERGMKINTGKYKNGAIHISKAEIEDIQNQGVRRGGHKNNKKTPLKHGRSNK